jgi:prepilin-type N-terminal cleavage/methylation domain-containing protein
MPISSRLASDQRGFTIVELLVSMVVSLLILGGAVSLTSQVQNGYRRQMEEVAAEQEGRYALDWVSRLIRAAGNNPYNIMTGDCPAAGTAFSGLIVDPNSDNVHNDIRIQTDSNPPDRLLGGALGACTQGNEDVTVSYDATTRSITFLDNNLGGGATIRTEPVITSLQFIYRDGSHDELTVNPITPAQVMYVETRITVQPRAIGNQSGTLTRVLSQEVRIKGRNF